MKYPMAQKRIKPVTFRVYPEGRFLYAEVNIWPTKKAMQNHVRLPGRNYDACCGGREAYLASADGSTRRTGLFAEANFHRRKIGVEVVSHEFTHAAFSFAERRKLNLSSAISEHKWGKGRSRKILDRDGVEERFCYALGQMVRQFTQKCYDLGMYEDVIESTAK